MPKKGESKSERFRRIATNRTRRILNDLRLLGNCANTNNYEYTEDDIGKIFVALDKEYRRVRSLFTKRAEEFKL